ncbi:hypothetical protein FISHEDRAFT_35754 [Fistulina hepatica ATCC 64428]|uniref:Uncharacterized protein n=1 Tax=Fistulina hepatica ATCC 64428 TaxID=1128425 RepID=A0A0D7ALD2_9AGAR|nr:hypothetical protein FISHEDRAFT_35754 [Fistulina hepatica ATCC 64428]
MIARGHHSALQFTKDMTRNPLYLKQYFKELEAAFANAHIMESRRKKEYAIHYPDVRQVEAWKALTEYNSDESDYNMFKKAVCRIYFGDTSRLYRSRDLEALCEEYRQKGFDTINKFRNFHRMFLSIYKYLTDTSDYSEYEASRTIWRTCNPRLTQAVQTRLNIKCPDADDDIYPLEEVIATAKFCCPPAPIPEPFYAGVDFVAIRTVLPTVNNREEVELILDHGSQIVTVSATCSKKLSLAYNPNISVQLQSANGEFNRTLGVACNVPFKFESVKVYLQCHVVETNAYEILLGRLFFTLTTSIMNIHSHQDEMIMITDPNSHKCLTLPTYSRGEVRYAHYAAKVGKDTTTEVQEQAEGFRPASICSPKVPRSQSLLRLTTSESWKESACI